MPGECPIRQKDDHQRDALDTMAERGVVQMNVGDGTRDKG